MPWAGLEPAISESERLQTDSLDCAVIGTGAEIILLH